MELRRNPHPRAPSPAAQAPPTSAPRRSQGPDASHILLADFYGLDPAGNEFADSVSKKIDIEPRRFEEEELPKMPVHVQRDSADFKRLHCFVEDHADADRVAAALGADLIPPPASAPRPAARKRGCGSRVRAG